MKKIIFIVVGIVIVILLLFVSLKSCSQQGGRSSLNTAVVERSDVARTVIATGKIEPLYKAEIKSKIGGLVKQFFVEEGDFVKAGQKLVEVIPGTTPIEMVQARSEVKIAAYEKEVSEKRYRRAEELMKENLISPDEFDEASVYYFSAKARFYAAMAQMKVLEQGLNVTALADEIELTQEDRVQIAKETEEALASMTIIAPIEGIVLSRDTDQGSAVIPMTSAFGGTVIMTLADVSEKHFRGDVDEADIGKVSLGLPTRIFVETFPDQPFLAQLTMISPLGREEEDIVNFEIRAIIEDNSDKLKVGMSADAEIILQEQTDVLVVPEGAIHYEGDRTYVEVQDELLEEGRRQVDILKGISDGIRTEVLTGLEEGDVVILPQ
ncbi:efflux RND transporter periplasmic adaptor subunit [bacterium]|nr:efflux RND transporter periplasmic adaptor subunit [bacterium]RQV92202.1 MAG: HlyD family efflux transporter periplasmic adaptor subunit [bacterium]